jgi:hypothetical protein
MEGVRTLQFGGGPFSVTLDLTPALGRLGDPRCHPHRFPTFR